MKKPSHMIIVGAGLAGLITAWRCLHSSPELEITVITKDDNIGGNQIWTFNQADILPELKEWVAPFIAHTWPRYDVKFPTKTRTLEIPYCSSNTDTLLNCVQPFIDAGRLHIKLNTEVTSTNLQSVTLSTGKTLKAHYVVDARGFKPRSGVVHAYKKVTGQTIRTASPHGLTNPIVMDTNIPQLDGFEYIYCLPFTEHEILVQHICYSDNDKHDEDKSANIITAYLASKNWEMGKILHQESTVLPLTLASNINPETIDIDDTSQATKVGMRCGYYHAVTGYSFAECLKSALVIDEYIQADINNFAHGAAREMNQHEIDHFREERFMRLFNRIAFRAVKPSQRYKAFEHVYNQSEDLIARFYQGRMERNDKLKLLALKPPISVLKMLKYTKDKSMLPSKK